MTGPVSDNWVIPPIRLWDETYLRPELPSLGDHRVEVAEREEDALELGLLGTHLERFLERDDEQEAVG